MTITPKGSMYLYSTYMHRPTSKDIGTSYRPKYIPYSYMDPLGQKVLEPMAFVSGPKLNTATFPEAPEPSRTEPRASCLRIPKQFWEDSQSRCCHENRSDPEFYQS